MEDFNARMRAELGRDERREPLRRNDLARRPDRVALWAFLMAIAITAAAAASAQGAGSGGVSSGGGEASQDGMVGQVATWYGPGFYGNRTACGEKLRRKTVGVAHRRLPCGTEVTFTYQGRSLTTEVIDRGPFANGAKWDLTRAAAKQLGLTHTDEVLVSVSGR